MTESDQIRETENQDSQQRDEMNQEFKAVNNEREANNQRGESEQRQEPRNNRSNGGTSNRGFAAMSPERQRQIASEGGRAAHKQGVAHEWNSDEARTAGRKGGQIVSQNREHMSEIGRRGGQSSGGRRNRNQQNEAESTD
jgi:general stress protein YciG